ncbi:DUF2203 domain-containing protein [Sulfolobus acidocaldarius]|uniref:Conserved Archaeal protein n=4 Tax=Sulfolobus acidocaldarius TaxID=2285 RepID=Q4JBM9_SULAC|nr:DUF2203 domain-containing protein [Sulfolobus acidocaldarius]AAY79800.1 conserved Archaeal protein [Sulfolobus acidocaldarius DSM 639]AGE70358.1 hypothetical protein SacN8_01885 [Sulfolobus acidocaldarius N8]AGE72633.1 hypothetical protein SacRon12I_01885 [Sulfolobus acidocaldarius Ron12/I]ALU29244.1 hypothetical protein ATY89_04365 [Sulfolobus acidocaldarius]ALU31973.1 hypothetical protein ATZ20_07390 [Sulfolobus acidocaldarius]
MEYPYFDLKTARELLPWLREKLKEIKRVKRLVEESLVRGDKSSIFKYTVQVDMIVREITEKGIVLRDPDIGLVDFPALINNKPAYLCWKLDEEDILYWHYAEEGFRGRKRISGTEDILSLT